MVDHHTHGTKEVWKEGEHAYFEYHCQRSHDSSDAEAWYRDHQRVVVIDLPDSDGKDWLLDGASAEERADASIPMIYTVRFADGHEHDVFEDELLVSPVFFSAKCGPPPPSEISIARQAQTS